MLLPLAFAAAARGLISAAAAAAAGDDFDSSQFPFSSTFASGGQHEGPKGHCLEGGTGPAEFEGTEAVGMRALDPLLDALTAAYVDDSDLGDRLRRLFLVRGIRRCLACR